MAYFTTEQIAGVIYEHCLSALAYEDVDTLALAHQVNESTGWTIEESLDNKLRGNIIRHENVRVSREQVQAAHALAMTWP